MGKSRPTKFFEIKYRHTPLARQKSFALNFFSDASLSLLYHYSVLIFFDKIFNLLRHNVLRQINHESTQAGLTKLSLYRYSCVESVARLAWAQSFTQDQVIKIIIWFHFTYS